MIKKIIVVVLLVFFVAMTVFAQASRGGVTLVYKYTGRGGGVYATNTNPYNVNVTYSFTRSYRSRNNEKVEVERNNVVSRVPANKSGYIVEPTQGHSFSNIRIISVDRIN